MQIIGESLGSDLSTLVEYEQYFEETSKGEVRFYFDKSLTQDEINQLEQEILGQGVVLTETIVQDSRVVSIKFQKMLAPLAIIAIVVGGIVAIGVGLLGWQIWKTTQLGVPIWAWLVGGAALAYILLREPVKKAAPYAIKAGKVYITRKVAK